MDTKVVTTHIPLDLAEKIDNLSVRLQRSRGWIVKQALQAWVVQQDHRAAPSGFAEVQLPFEAEAAEGDRVAAAAAVVALKSLRANTTLGDVSWRELRDAGRR